MNPERPAIVREYFLLKIPCLKRQPTAGEGDRKAGADYSIVNVIVLVLLVILLIATLPLYRYSREWGYYPSGIVAAILVILTFAFLHSRQ